MDASDPLQAHHRGQQKCHCQCKDATALRLDILKRRELLQAVSLGHKFETCLTGEQAVSMRWPEICQRLQDSLHVILAAADWPALGRQLIEGPQQKQENEPELVTAKVSKLCQLLLVGKVVLDPSEYCSRLTSQNLGSMNVREEKRLAVQGVLSPAQ